ncbi:MAG: hypothetical protein EPO26_05275 [Chloroflexota bacterium]|nr:MAG: hypothetical protein EPO26_05275 [Chloroflexota bacterium]
MSATSSYPDVRGRVGAVSAVVSATAPSASVAMSRPTRALASVASFLGLAVLSWCAAVVAHELLVLSIAAALPGLLTPAFVEPIIGALPVNYVYATAMARFAGQIEPAGIAVAGDVGDYLATALPGLFQNAGYVSGTGPLSAVIAPGSSLLARAVVAAIANVALLALGLVFMTRATRSVGTRSLARVRGSAAALLVGGGTMVAEVAARILRDFGSTRDLETIGILPFVFHQLLRLPTETYDRFTQRLGMMLDPAYQIAILGTALVAAFVIVCAIQLLARIRVRDLRRALRAPFAARGWQTEVPDSAPGRRRIFDTVLIAVLVAAMPVLDIATPATRFLDWIGEPIADVEPAAVEPEEIAVEMTAVVAIEIIPSLTIESGPATVAPPTPFVPSRRYVPPPGLRPSIVTVAGQGLRYSYIVNGEPTMFKGMGYNVTHATLPREERTVRMREDFAAMREAGVNTIVGWRTPEWDETLLDVAQAAGLGVVIPWDFDEKLDYADRAVRNRVKSDVLAWVTRYRRHPAVHVWGLGNETLLHLRQTARARAFGEFYTDLVDTVRAFDPDHPVMAREAEDVYIRWIQEPWRARGGPPAGFIVGMNFYTFRMREAIEEWPKRAFDAPIVVSEFAPAGFGRVDRPTGYRRMWSMIRSRPEMILGVAPYVWSVDGPEPSDRIFGLTENGKAIDGSLGAMKELYRAPAAPDGWVTVPSLTGVRAPDAEKIVEDLGLKLVGVIHQRASDLADASQVRRFGIGRVIHQQPAAGTKARLGTEARLAISAAPLVAAWPVGRSRED